MYTFQDLIYKYAKDVGERLSDTDLTAREARLVEVMLNISANGFIAMEPYPPSENVRNEVVTRLCDIIWDARPLMYATSPRSEVEIDKAIGRATEILRNL